MVKFKPETVDLSIEGVSKFTQEVIDGKLKVRGCSHRVITCVCLGLG